MNKKLVKELFIIALLAIVVIFILGILFYDYIPVEQKITSVKYVADENVISTINEIKSNSGEDIEENKQDSLLQSYTIDKDELSNYQNDNSYESGKVDPFAEDSEPVDEKTTTHKLNIGTNTYQSGKVENKVTTNAVKTNTVKDDKKTNTVKGNNTKTNTVTSSKTNTTNTTNTAKTNTTKTNTVKNETKTNTVKKEPTTGKFFENEYSK